MSYLLPFFVLFATSGIYLCLLGLMLPSPSRRWEENVLRAPWVGWSILLGALQVTHLFAPIDKPTATFLITGMVGAAIILLIRARFRQSASIDRARGETFFLIGALAIASLLAFLPVFNACTKQMILYDLGLYLSKDGPLDGKLSDRSGTRQRSGSPGL